MIRVLFALLLVLTFPAHARLTTAKVSGYAESFITDKRLMDGTVTILETGETLTTNADGRFGPIDWPVGEPITLRFEKEGYVSTQSATVTVPDSGSTDIYHEITFQVPSNFMMETFKNVMGIKFEKGHCHVASTITDYHKTMQDVPQGVAGAKVHVIPEIDEKPFYFGVYDSGPLKDKTNPFEKGLTETSLDGGIFLFNVPVSSEPYTLYATRTGVPFTTAQFTCTEDQFINLSPPQGPTALFKVGN